MGIFGCSLRKKRSSFYSENSFRSYFVYWNSLYANYKRSSLKKKLNFCLNFNFFSQEELWSSDPNQFVSDEEDSFNAYSVRSALNDFLSVIILLTP